MPSLGIEQLSREQVTKLYLREFEYQKLLKNSDMIHLCKEDAFQVISVFKFVKRLYIEFICKFYFILYYIYFLYSLHCCVSFCCSIGVTCDLPVLLILYLTWVFGFIDYIFHVFSVSLMSAFSFINFVLSFLVYFGFFGLASWVEFLVYYKSFMFSNVHI